MRTPAEPATQPSRPASNGSSLGSSVIVILALLIYVSYVSSNGGLAAALKPLQTTITNLEALAGDKSAQKKIDATQKKARTESDKAGDTNAATASNYGYVAVGGDWALKGDASCVSLKDPVTKAAQRANLDPRLLMALIHTETVCNTINKIACGGTMTQSYRDNGALGYAVGPAQLLKSTAAGLKVDRCNLADNLWGGARYLRGRLKAYDGDLTLALKSYNGGNPANAAPGYAQSIESTFSHYGGAVRT